MNKILPLIILCILFLRIESYAQSRVITGVVTNAQDNSPLPGVNIFIKGTSTGTITDFEGRYSLGVPADATSLVFSYIGFISQEIAIQGKSVIDVSLAEDAKQLDELVVTGYTMQNKRDILGSITSVKPDELRQMPIVGFDQALQGQASGVMVTQSSGEPGGGIMVRIRGNSSISSSNRPLFIVDGIPVRDGGLTGRSFGGQQDNAIASLNPNDIESIEILKDASAKAMFGSRAANGVVLITTKRGKAGERTRFEVDVQRGLSDPTGRVDLLNAAELLELQRESLINAGQDPNLAGIPGVTDAVDTDWINAVTRRALYEQYQLSASGGSDKTRFYLSGSFRDEEGVIVNNSFTRMTGAANIDHNANKRLNFGLNISAGRTLNRRVKGDNFLDGVYSGALRSLPYYAPYDENGNFYVPGNPGYAEFPNFNPLAQAILPRFDTYATKLLGGFNARYEIMPNLSLSTRFSLDYTSTIEDQFEPSGTAIGGFLPSIGGRGYGVYSTGESSQFLNTTTLIYNKTIGEKHALDGLLGTEILERVSRSSFVSGQFFPSDDFTYITSAGLVNDGSSFLIESGLISFFGQLNYKYQDRYLVTLNARYDGSSRFGEDRKFGFFPSASVGWRLSEEQFLQNFEKIDDLKLRMSYGITGNERIGDFQFLGTWAASNAYNGVPAISPATLANPLLQWEQTTEFNIGADISLYSGRVQINADYYYNTTNDLLLSEILPLTTGFGSVLGNLGEVTNQGAELTINSINFNGPLRWSTQFNISRNQNIVRKLATDEPQFAGYNTFTNSTHIIKPGYPLGTYWGLVFLGVDPGTGNAIYKDVNNDGELTAEDGTVIGNAQPDFFGGLTNTWSYKGFELSLFLQFSYGNEMINFAKTSMVNSGQDIENNQTREALLRWRNPGDITSVPRYEFENTFNNRFSSRFVEDASYLRIKNLSLAYNVPSKWVEKYRLEGVRLFVSGTNLWTLTNYSGADPEVNSLDGSTVSQGLDFYTLPQVRTLMAGINLRF
ncbi:MAG: TonB-dependent receptor [Cyclobacteriaceae bacterium]|nr:TonB-dependent receptor [Cyclobacteriaceae bacterium]